MEEVVYGTDAVCIQCHGAGILLQEPDEGWAFQVPVPLPCHCTVERQEARERAELLVLSGLGDQPAPTFADFDPERDRDLARTKALCQDFAREPRGFLILSGPMSSGKTLLAKAICKTQIDLVQRVMFVVVADLLDHLRATYHPNSLVEFDPVFHRVRNADLLILDDLGAEKNTPWALEKMYQVFNHRLSHALPTVITTNLEPNDLPDRLMSRAEGGQVMIRRLTKRPSVS